MAPRNFGGLENEFTDYQKSEIVVLPIPYDATSTWIKGTDKGPDAIIEASMNMELYDIDTDSTVAERGIYTAPPINSAGNPEKMIEEIAKVASKFVEDEKFVVGLGGEHSVSVGLVMAQKEAHPKLSVLQLDAHSDLRETYLGSKYNHACTMSRIKELCPSVHVGIRSMEEGEPAGIEPGRMFFAKDIHDNDKWMDRVISLLSDEVYVTIDLDVLDPSEMSSVGTPEPGGLDWYHVTNFLSRVAERKKVVGFDVVELCPNPYNKAPDFLASKLAYVFLSRIFKKRP
jgi:agmatinase